jgi:outer membrane protein TolC
MKRALPVLLLTAAACSTPEEYATAADREVYELLDARRSELFNDAAGFRVEPAADRLRVRLLEQPDALVEPVSLVECLEIAADNNRDYQQRKERLYRAALSLTLERWRFSTNFTLDGSVGIDGVGDDAATASADADLGMSRLLGTGANIVGSIGASLFRVISTGDGWDALSDLTLSVTQPLLRGAAREVVMEPLTQSERDLIYEVRNYERFRRTFAVDVANDYYAILVTLDQIANEEANLIGVRLIEALSNARTDAGRLSPIQRDQARQDVLTSETSLLQLQARFGQQLDSFKLSLGLPPEAGLLLDPSELVNLRDLDGTDIELLDSDDLTVGALARRLDYINTAEAVIDAERRARIAADALRAGLDIEATIGSTSEEGHPISYRSGVTPWSLGIGWDLPIDNLPDRNAYRSALLDLQSAMRTEENSRDTVLSGLRDDLRQATNARERHEVQLTAVLLAERRVQSTQLNFDAGRVETRDLLDARRSLLSAQNSATSALRDFAISRLRLYNDLELLEVSPEGIHVFAPAAP